MNGYISVTGGMVWYEIIGEEKNATPLLVLHGGPGSPHDYLKPLEALASDRPVIFYDQLGCGKSDKPNDTSLWTVERYVKELSELRQFLAIDKLHILGNSWGTMLACRYMIDEKPKGVASLILSAPCLSASRWAADQRRYIDELPSDKRETILKCEANGDYESKEYQDAMIFYYKRHVCRLDPWPEILLNAFGQLNMDIYRHMWGPSEFTVSGTLKNFDVTERLLEIKVPTLFTCGRFDEATPKTTSYYQSKLPGSEIAIFEDASHLHLYEKTEEYLKTVRGFLRRVKN